MGEIAERERAQLAAEARLARIEEGQDGDGETQGEADGEADGEAVESSEAVAVAAVGPGAGLD